MARPRTFMLGAAGFGALAFVSLAALQFVPADTPLPGVSGSAAGMLSVGLLIAFVGIVSLILAALCVGIAATLADGVRSRRVRGRCTRCGYQLDRRTGGVCSECGARVTTLRRPR